MFLPVIEIPLPFANSSFVMYNKVGPQAVFVVGRDDDDESISGGSEVSDDAASWETVCDDEMDALENANQVVL